MPLAAVNDHKMMAAAIVAAVAPRDPGAKSPEAQLVELLRHRTLLLVLDNLEQISDAAPLIAAVLAACPLVVILATSRERLHLRAEQRFKVPPLELNSAVELFVQRAQAVSAEFHPTPDTYVTIAAICRRLDCLPLAVELCAAQVEILSPVHLLAQLQTRALDLLVDGPHDLASQHHTLRRAIQHSYALLAAEEQRLFRGLGIFVGSFDLAAVVTICNHPAPGAILHALIGKSLVRAETVTADEQRFSLLETIRAFALEQARTHGEEAQLRQRHYATYLQRFRTADAHLRGPEVARWFARLDPDYDNLRSAVNWTLAAGHYADGAWLLVASSWYSRLRGQWYEEIGWFETVLPHDQQLAPALRLTFLICFCSLARSPEEYETINSYATDLMALTQLCPDKVLGAGVWHFLAKAAPDFAQAASAWERSIALAREALHVPGLGPEYGVGSDPLFILGGALDFYATRLLEQGVFAQAGPLIAESHAVSVARGFRSGIGAALSNRGLLALLQGNLGQARLHLAEALTITTTSIFPAVRAKTKTLLGLTMLYHNNPREARRLLLAALALWTNIRDKPYLAIVAIYLAETALWERQTAEAEQWLAQGLRDQVEPRWLGSAVVNCLHVAARLAVLREAYEWAATLFGLAEETSRRMYYTLVEPVRAQNRAALVRAQASLDLARFGAAFAAGQQMTVEDAFATLRATTGHESTAKSLK